VGAGENATEARNEATKLLIIASLLNFASHTTNTILPDSDSGNDFPRIYIRIFHNSTKIASVNISLDDLFVEKQLTPHDWMGGDFELRNGNFIIGRATIACLFEEVIVEKIEAPTRVKMRSVEVESVEELITPTNSSSKKKNSDGVHFNSAPPKQLQQQQNELHDAHHRRGGGALTTAKKKKPISKDTNKVRKTTGEACRASEASEA